MKRHIYRSSLFLTFFVSLVFLNDYSIQYAGSASCKKNQEIQKLTAEKSDPFDLSEYNLPETDFHSAPARLPNCSKVWLETHFHALCLNKSRANPALIDLPPPAVTT